ncbi:hypothetical protein N0V86_004983 [Didymella sp. IMI 355093]|nr:hypothetical protein N0V86_004983 [Didymella sp. IMI 355093]
MALTSKKSKAPRLTSPEQTFLCQDKDYPRTRTKSLRPIQKVYMSSDPPVHWRGDERALFKLDPAAKYNIRDYLAERCTARIQTTNELTKPTGTKVVFVLRFSDGCGAQKALCVQTNATSLNGIYNFRNVHPSIKKSRMSRTIPADSMRSEARRMLPRSRGTTSLACMMATANEESFPLPDHELDSDSDEEQEEVVPSPYTTALDAITEGDEDEEAAGGFVDVIDFGAPKYCHDPDSAHHPECRGRYKALSYTYNVEDAELDLQERFVRAHGGHDSAAYYRNWRTLKLDHGETLVHGQSSLRNLVADTGEGDERDDSDEIDDPTEQLIRLIAKKYGPLTFEGQKTQLAQTEENLSEECIFKVDKYFSCQTFDYENEEAVYESIVEVSNTLERGDDDALASAPTPAAAETNSRNTPVMTEEELEKVSSLARQIMDHTDYMKIVNTPHEDFVNNYVQRYEAMKTKAARAKQASNETTQEIASVALDAVAEQVAVLPELIITAATPASSPIKEITPLVNPIAIDRGNTAPVSSGTCPVVSEPAPEIQSCTATTPAPAALYDEIVASQVLPVFIAQEQAPLDIPVRPASSSSTCSSHYGSSHPASVFPWQASVTTKPSNESFWTDQHRLVDTLDLQVKTKIALTTVSRHECSMNMPVLTCSVPNTRETFADVSEPNHSAHGQATYAGPSTLVRATSSASKCLTPTTGIQTPLTPSPMPPTTMYASTAMDDPFEGILTSQFQYEQPNAQISSQAPYRLQDDPIQLTPASVFTDDSSFAIHRQQGSKLAAFKYRAHVVISATKQTTRCALRSIKKMRAAAQYSMPATFGSRNPFETVSRR